MNTESCMASCTSVSIMCSRIMLLTIQIWSPSVSPLISSLRARLTAGEKSTASFIRLRASARRNVTASRGMLYVFQRKFWNDVKTSSSSRRCSAYFFARLKVARAIAAPLLIMRVAVDTDTANLGCAGRSDLRQGARGGGSGFALPWSPWRLGKKSRVQAIMCTSTHVNS